MQGDLPFGVAQWAYPPVDSDKIELFFRATPSLREEFTRRTPRPGVSSLELEGFLKQVQEFFRMPNQVFLLAWLGGPAAQEGLLYELWPWSGGSHHTPSVLPREEVVPPSLGLLAKYLVPAPPQAGGKNLPADRWRVNITLVPEAAISFSRGEEVQIVAHARALRTITGSTLRGWVDQNLGPQLKALARQGVSCTLKVELVGDPFRDSNPTRLTLTLAGFASRAASADQLLQEVTHALR